MGVVCLGMDLFIFYIDVGVEFFGWFLGYRDKDEFYFCVCIFFKSYGIKVD